MGIFTKFLYPIFQKQFKDCLPLEQCPAIQAELQEQTDQEVCKICEQCWNKLHSKSPYGDCEKQKMRELANERTR